MQIVVRIGSLKGNIPLKTLFKVHMLVQVFIEIKLQYPKNITHLLYGDGHFCQNWDFQKYGRPINKKLIEHFWQF